MFAESALSQPEIQLHLEYTRESMPFSAFQRRVDREPEAARETVETRFDSWNNLRSNTPKVMQQVICEEPG